MPFTITYGPANRIQGVSAGILSKDSALEAWELVQQLAASDERVTIKDPSGRIIDWVELRGLAQAEA